MRIRTKRLRQVIQESILNEEIRLAQDSVDDQIDSILLRFEKDCIIDGEQFDESVDLIKNLLEAPEDEDESREGESDQMALGDSEEENLTADKEDQEPDKPSDPMVPKIDVSKFAGKVSRLVTNQVNLLDIATAIVHRAFNYLDSYYSKNVAKEFAEILEREYEIPYTPKAEEEPEELPMARGAGASGIG